VAYRIPISSPRGGNEGLQQYRGLQRVIKNVLKSVGGPLLRLNVSSYCFSYTYLRLFYECIRTILTIIREQEEKGKTVVLGFYQNKTGYGHFNVNNNNDQ
jgi:hypothetical protein